LIYISSALRAEQLVGTSLVSILPGSSLLLWSGTHLPHRKLEGNIFDNSILWCWLVHNPTVPSLDVSNLLEVSKVWKAVHIMCWSFVLLLSYAQLSLIACALKAVNLLDVICCRFLKPYFEHAA